MEVINRYYSLTKPGVLYGNVITGVAGFLLAAGHFKRFDLDVFLATIGGMTLVIAAACALNNVLDQDIDRIMERTRNRVVAHGDISSRNATFFAIILGSLGLAILSIWVSPLVVYIGLVGFVTYVWLYGALSKRKSIHGTLVGSISGAMPILAGYVAVADKFDAAALLVFLMLFFWQFPEFYSIAIYRLKEYKAANVPVMPVVVGVKNTSVQIFIYTVLFVVSTLLLTPLGYTGWVYFAIMGLVGTYWVWLAAKGLNTNNSDVWARQMFHFSLTVLLALSAMLAVGPILP